jgi:hypothetical protein
MNTTITILDTAHRPVFYMNHDVSDTGFNLRLQVEPTEFGLTDPVRRQRLVPSIGSNRVGVM